MPGRVSLARLSAADGEEFVAAMRASRALHHPWITPPDTPTAFEVMLERNRDDTLISFVARRTGDRALIGYFNVSNVVRGALQGANLGYGAVAAHAGRGYMTEALGLVLAEAFGELRLHRIEAGIQPPNHRSIALVRRCGFVREGFSERYLKLGGEWRDHERWATDAERWGDWQRTGR